ncbi:hypothetical protein [Demequina capsici]|uniref:Protein kinase domain-containing protein n=1 Tax=Demequina capsici TaxID=3075620 RepID=A0AA96JD92_9MICO|nr:hypothetical protein [Demequina sp. OYTSA14]WNM24479.1 hypothetical protein RN606_14105 [Demequina sp. OYTSA14]
MPRQKFTLGGHDVQSGVTLARRFTLVSEEAFDVPGARRWQSKDSRLRKDATVFTLTCDDPNAVLASVARVTSVRDPRLVRVVASGHDDVEGASAAYVVVDRPRGVALAQVLARHTLPPRLAAAIVGSLARALEPLSTRGIHHGSIRDSAVVVADSGVPILSGLGIDNELLHQAGEGAPRTEAADADALARLYVLALSGWRGGSGADRPASPEGLDDRALEVFLGVLDGAGPSTLAEVVDAFPPDHGALRGFSGAVKGLPVRPEVAEAEALATLGKAPSELVDVSTLEKAAHTAAIADALALSAPDLAPDVAKDHLDALEAAVPPEEPPASASEPAADVVQVDSQGVPIVERGMFDDLEAYDEIVEEQNAIPAPSVWEALLERLHRRWPDSERVTRLLEQARVKASQPGPIPTRALLLIIGVLLLIVAVVTSVSLLKAPLNVQQDQHNLPSNTYPAYTYGTSASASASNG